MEEDQYDFIGDDGELLPRKPKPVEGFTLRTVLMITVVVSIVAAFTGSIVTYIVTSVSSNAAEETAISSEQEISLASTIDSMQLTQIAIADSAQFVNSLATQAAFMALSRPESTPTDLPPDQCYCDNPGCQLRTYFMDRGDSFDTLGIKSSDPNEFGWYLVRNLSETSGIHWEVYPADHVFVCESHWSNCQVRGFYNSYQCVLSQQYQVCDNLTDCRFSEPLLVQE